MKFKLCFSIVTLLLGITPLSWSGVYKSENPTKIEAGALYAIIDSPPFFNLPYAEVISANTNVSPSGGSQLVAGNVPSWNFFIKGVKSLAVDNKRTLSARYRNLSQGRGNNVSNASIEDKIGVVFTQNGEGTLLDGAAAIEMKMRYQDFDIMSENYDGVWPKLFPGFGSISTYYAYGIKFVNLQKSFVAKYVGTDASGVLGLVNDINTYGFNGSSGGVKINFGGLWQFNQHWNFDGYFGVGILAGLNNYNFNERTTTTTTSQNLIYNQGEKNLLWLMGDLEFEFNLNSQWEFKHNQKAIFSIGYQGEELIKSAATNTISQTNGNNSVSLRDNFTLMALKLSLAYQFA